jgi:hypothetical protein
VALSAGIVHDTKDQPICMLVSLHDITLQKESERASLEMERLKGRFQKEQERNTFVQRIISMLSHDLRTHLSVISTSRDILASGGGHISEEKRTEKLDTIRRQVTIAAELLDDAVNVARGAPIGVGLQLTEINLDQLCRIILEEISTTNHHQHRMIYTNHSDDLTALIDETLVSRILLNLLTNAIKYSPRGSEIQVELGHDPDFVILRVRDSGIGITEHDLQHIFEPFFRSADVRSINGTGLGLSIVKDCVERHQGIIEVESEYGKGSTFTVKLPLHN